MSLAAIPLPAPLAARLRRPPPPPLLPLAFDPARPDEALPAAIVARRQQQSPNWVVVVLGFGVGLAVWFRTFAMLPLLSGLAPWARRILAALPLLTLPWWMDAFPAAIGHFSRDAGDVVAGMFADVAPTDRLVATTPGEATLVDGERIVWRLPDSVYAGTFGAFRYAPPAQPYATSEAAFAAIAATIATQARALDDGRRAELFARLSAQRRSDLTAVDPAFVPAAKEAAADPAAGEATRAAARRFLQ
jgi:hypothetical protein